MPEKMDNSAPSGGSDAYIQTMVEAAPLVIILWNKNLQAIDCNQEMVRLLGTTSKKECMDRFFEFAREYQPNGQKSSEMATEKLTQAFETGRCRFEWVFWSVSGERIPCEVTLVRININNDPYVISYANDVRELKASLEKIEEANERTLYMFEKAPMIIMMWDQNNNILDCNEEAIRLYGVKDKQDYVNRFYDLAPEYQPNGQKSADMAAEKHREAFETGASHFEWTHRNVKGEPIPCEVHIYRVKYDDDYNIVSYAKDLRPVKKAIAEIKEANERTQSMFENTPAVIMLWNKDYQILDCNMEAIRMFGLKDKKEYIERFFDLAPEHQPNGQKSTDMAAEKLNEAFETGSSRFEWTHHSISGEKIPFLLRAFRIKYGDDYVVVSYARDLREQKEIEELTKQQAAAEAAKRAKSAFLAQMGHEMRTPMNAIIGMMSIGKNAADIERKDYALDKIENAAKHLLGVINDVLDISEIETDRLELISAEFNFELMLQDVLDFIQFSLDEMQHRFTMNIDKRIPHILVGDSHRLAQVITNLLSNAIKFTPKQGKVGLDIILASEKDGMCELRVEVSDNGIGIAADQQATLFEAFVQAEGGTNRLFGGTGLGLTISKRIIELMNGNIRVESEIGKGARFIFTVKLNSNERRVNSEPVFEGTVFEEEEGSDTADPADIANKLAGKTILIVEDVEINREILISLLEETGLIIDSAQNGLEAVEMVKANPNKYDLVFMDMQMPQMDGLEATRRIRTLLVNHKKNLPIIAMTANVLKSDVETCLAAGMDDHIGKPFEIDAVIKKLHDYLEA